MRTTILIALALTGVVQVGEAEVIYDSRWNNGSYIRSVPRCSYCNRPGHDNAYNRCPQYIADERQRADNKAKEAQRKREQDKKLAEHKEMLAKERAENIRKAQVATAPTQAKAPPQAAMQTPSESIEAYVHDGPELFGIPLGAPEKHAHTAMQKLEYYPRKYEGSSVTWAPSDRAGPLFYGGLTKSHTYDTKSVLLTIAKSRVIGLKIESPVFNTTTEASDWYTSAIWLIDSVFNDLRKFDNGDNHYYGDGAGTIINVDLNRRAKTASIEVKIK